MNSETSKLLADFIETDEQPSLSLHSKKDHGETPKLPIIPDDKPDFSRYKTNFRRFNMHKATPEMTAEFKKIMDIVLGKVNCQMGELEQYAIQLYFCSKAADEDDWVSFGIQFSSWDRRANRFNKIANFKVNEKGIRLAVICDSHSFRNAGISKHEDDGQFVECKPLRLMADIH